MSFGLTAEQEAIVGARNVDVVVSAHPGSGKTSTAANYIADRLAAGRDPETITAISFTRAASAILRDRATAVAGPAAALARFATSHSFAWEIVRAKFRDLGFRTLPTILDADEAAHLVNVCASSFKSPLWAVRAALAVEREALAAGANLGGRILVTKSPAERAAGQYLAALVRNNCLDYAGLLTYATAALSRDAVAAKAYSYGASTLIWDEAQDSSPEEGRFVARLSPRETLIVGDPAQSIYGFRGATGELLKDSKTVLRREPVELPLTGNFRSTDEIVDYCNLLRVRMGLGRTEAKLGVNGPKPRFVEVVGEDALKVALAGLTQDGFFAKGGTCAIIARQNRTTIVAASILAAAGVKLAGPASRTRTDPRIGERLLRAICGWMRNPFDINFARMLSAFLPGATIAKATAKAERAGVSLPEALGLRPPEGLDALDAYVERMKDPPTDGFPFGNVTPHVMTELRRTLGGLKLLVRLRGSSEAALDEFLMDGALTIPEETESPEGSTWIGTAHAAKGGEWDRVAILDDFADAPSPGSPESSANSEGLRVAYVAASRARKELLLISDSPKDSVFWEGRG